MKKSIYSVLWVLLTTAFIFYNSSQSAVVSQQYSMGLLRVLCDAVSAVPFFDFLSDHLLRKAAHWTEFFLQAIFMCMFCFSTLERWWRGLIYILFLGLLTALTDEYIQLFSPGRSSMVQDVWLDFSGTISGILFVMFVRVMVIFRLIYKMNK